MRIIVKGKQDLLPFFSPIKPTNKKYKQSIFILRLEKEDGTLLCNTLSGELLFLTPEEKELFDNLPSVINEEIKELISRRYLVPEDCKETQTADQIRLLLMKKREASKTILHYNILPTTSCNARCFYCYEHGIRQSHMTEETAEQLVQFISEHHHNQKVKLDWFGGEPTIGKKRIDQICSRLDELNISYESGMVSNAYLFDEALVRHARDKWNLKKIQITLDGTEEIYNRTKSYSGVSGSPYQRVLRNIGLFLEAGIHVAIRLNLGIHNAEDLSGLIDELSDRYREHSNISIYIRQLNQNEGSDPIRQNREEYLRIKKLKAELEKQLEEKGWPLFKAQMFPRLKISSCMADNPGSIQCTPDGILSKCEDMIYEHTVGTLTEGVTDHQESSWWREKTRFSECNICPLYPSCVNLLAHCPVRQDGCPTDFRERSIKGYQKLMLIKYQDWKREAQAEETDDK